MLHRFAFVFLSVLAGSALALEYRAVNEPSILYNAPATKAARLFIIARYTPVEVVVTVAGWAKVRDIKGNLAWIESKSLGMGRTVLVRAEKAQVYAQADEKSTKVFEAEKDVALELVDANPAGWAKVKHRDGQAGFVKVAQVWGL